MSREIKVKIEVDVRGLRCPMPLLKAKQALNRVNISEVVCVRATDVNSVKDIANFVQLTSHILLESDECEGTFTYFIQKGNSHA